MSLPFKQNWTSQLAVVKRGKKVTPYPHIRNALIALNHCPALCGLFARNEFLGRIETTRASPWETEPAEICDEDISSLADYLIKVANLDVSIALLEKAVAVAAKENSFDPLKDWVIDLPEWDQTERLSNLFGYYFGAEGNQEYLAAVSRAFLISCIARASKPGCKVDTVPILEVSKVVENPQLFAC